MDAGRSEPEEHSRFVLFLGNVQPHSAASRLKTSGVRYMRKRLESGPANWAAIRSLLEQESLVCVVAQLNTAVFNALASEAYAGEAPRLLEALARVPHIAFAHESVMTGEQVEPGAATDSSDDSAWDEESWIDHLRRIGYFRSPSDTVRSTVAGAFEGVGIRLVPYSTNAEFEVMADEFVKDNERDLLFRVYVPAGRLYAVEADKLLSLFREWLTRVGRQGVRQDGYETTAGHMYEFYGDGRPRSQDLSDEFRDFSSFLDVCVEDPRAAQELLTDRGLDGTTAGGLVARFSKEAQRLSLDLKQEREARVLAIRHAVESELLEHAMSTGDIAPDDVAHLVETLVPAPPASLGGVLGLATRGLPTPPPVTVNLNQQFIEKVEGAVVQSLHGTAQLGPTANELLELVRRFGADEASVLTTAVLELEDRDADSAARVRAKQLLKGFLIKIGGIAEDVATSALTKYLEQKLGS